VPSIPKKGRRRFRRCLLSFLSGGVNVTIAGEKITVLKEIQERVSWYSNHLILSMVTTIAEGGGKRNAN